MRIKGQISEFEMRIESRKSLFKLPEFDEREFEYMLSKAKKEAMVSPADEVPNKIFIDRHSVYSFFQNIIFSPKVAAVLVFTILAISMVWYNNSMSLLANNRATAVLQNPTVHSIDKNTRLPVENNNVMVISTYTEKHF